MIARDEESSPTQHRVWTVDGYTGPDLTGAHYHGLKSGHRPLLDIIPYQIDGYQPIDFLFPDVSSWKETKRVLPAEIYNSQLAIIKDGYSVIDGYNLDGYNDGYVFLFGSIFSSDIYRATLNNPADFTAVGALPSLLHSSSFALIDGYNDGYHDGYSDGYLYLMGGVKSDGYASDHIFSSTTFNPLAWQDRGSRLPQAISNSSLVILNGYIYLLGGKNDGGAVNNILRAPTTNPLLWEDTLATLPQGIYNSHVAIADGYIWLFGGRVINGMTDKIFSAPINSPLSWSQAGTLPYPAADGQLAVIGDKVYLFSPTNSQTTPTKILQAPINDLINGWIDTTKTLHGEFSSFQIMIVYDRIFALAANGNTSIFACDQILKPDFSDPSVEKYGDTTRTQVRAAINPLDLFKTLGFPPWKTDYR